MQDEGVLAHIIVDANKGDISCGAPIAIVVDDDAEYAEFLKLSPEVYVTTSSSSDAPAAATSPATTEAAPASSGRGAPLRMSPAARHMIASQGLAMEGILGTAKRGAVLSKEDVINAVKSGAAKPKPKAATSSAPQPASQIVTSSTATASASRAANFLVANMLVVVSWGKGLQIVRQPSKQKKKRTEAGHHPPRDI